MMIITVFIKALTNLLLFKSVTEMPRGLEILYSLLAWFNLCMIIYAIIQGLN